MSKDHIKLYTSLLSSVYNGTALWNPDQGYNAKDLKRRPHIRPGDVGYIDEDGSFVRLFNLHLEKDHPEQGRAVPEEFEEPLTDNSELSFEAPDLHHFYKRTAWRGSAKAAVSVSPANAGASLSYEFEHKTGAILGFFDTGVRHKSPQVADYEKEFVKNGRSWLRAAQTVRSGLDDTDLKLVTQCTRVQSWVRGILEDKSTEGSFSLSVGIDPVSAGSQISRTVEYRGGGNIKYGPGERIKKSSQNSITSLQNSSQRHKGKDKKRSGKEKASVSASASQSESSASSLPNTGKLDVIRKLSDQCIFIHSYRMQSRRNWFSQRFQAGAGPHHLPKGDDPDKDVLLVRDQLNAEESSSHHQQPSLKPHWARKIASGLIPQKLQASAASQKFPKDKEEAEEVRITYCRHCHSVLITLTELGSYGHCFQLYFSSTISDFQTVSILTLHIQKSDAELALVHEDDLWVHAKSFPIEV
ncbi:hypothetical protein GYMLUDRAFT_57151 [Collybiopsis luxurians FD-317 M1]|uniref:Unplaced genomic scaffold GYMLUscaffold_14, whole genome shotgun sequence n=1 Tax=Collybiopsis luxurians FD-317 M1 TaxID=944289 RepID=A0A0D0BJ23_9AGAR|nr:hypothetical protein GYMLUDRAFT_57151 [Collybiopsis luxurians FD-317 M1]